jgi:hypothetical protein
MNKPTHLVGTGIAVFVGSVLAIAPVAVTAKSQAPDRVCLEDTSIGECGIADPASESGGAGSRVAAQELPTIRIDAKDHPNYGQVTPEVYLDAKDHPNYGQVTPEVYLDAKDHPNYGQVTPEVYLDAKDHPNYGQVTPEADQGSGNDGRGGGRAGARAYAV